MKAENIAFPTSILKRLVRDQYLLTKAVMVSVFWPDTKICPVVMPASAYDIFAYANFAFIVSSLATNQVTMHCTKMPNCRFSGHSSVN